MRIAVTFHTRSLKGQFKRPINNFCIGQSGEEPDWTKLRVVSAWGAPGDDQRRRIPTLASPTEFFIRSKHSYATAREALGPGMLVQSRRF